MLYPSAENPHFGVFIKREVDSLAEHYSQKVIIPSPWRPAHGIRSLFNSRKQTANPDTGVEEIYKSYFPLPGRFFQPVKGIWFFLFLVGLIKKIQKDFDFDLIHAHNAYPEGFCAILLKHFFKKPVVISCRGNDLHKLPDNYLLRPMIKHALSRADSVITVSKSLSSKAVALGADPEKTSVMPKGVDPSVFRPMSKTKARQNLDLPQDKVVVLSVGWLIPRKNPFSFTEVLKRYPESERSRFLFVWVGEGPLQADMEKEIYKDGLQNHIRLVGRKNPEEVAMWMNAADIFVLVSFSEGMPNVLFEAMGCGIPVIASNVDGAAEIIRNGENGMLVSPDDYGMIAEKIKELADNRELSATIGNNGRKFMENAGLNWEENAVWMMNRYQAVMQQRVQTW